MALSPPTERMIRAALALQVAVLEWDQATAPHAHQTNAPTPRAALEGMGKALLQLNLAFDHIKGITLDAQE